MKDYISNTLIILFAFLIMSGIAFLIYKDINLIHRHLEDCKKQCYPALVVEQFSRKKCFCQPIEEVNEQ